MANEVLYFGGAFNFTDPLLGWQLYIWGWIAIVIASIITWVAFRYGSWEKYRPVWGLYYAFKGESHAAFIFNSELISELLSEKDAKCIFDYSKWNYKGLNKIQKIFFNYATVFLPNLPFAKALLYKFGGKNLDVEIAKKMQNGEWEQYSSATLGGIHTDLILDADRWSVPDSPQHKIVETTAEQWNDANPGDQIHAHPKFMRYLAEGKIKKPDGIKDFMVVPWSRIDSSFPIALESDETEGAVRQFAKELEEEDNQTLISKNVHFILLGGMGFAVLLLAMRFAMHFLG